MNLAFLKIFRQLVVAVVLATLLASCRSVEIPQVTIREVVKPNPRRAIIDKSAALDDLLPGVSSNDVDSSAQNSVAERSIDAGVVSKRFLNVNKVLPDDAGTSLFLNNENFITRWNLLGPFQYSEDDLLNSGNISILHKELVPNEKALTGAEDVVKGIKWRLVNFITKTQPGRINLGELYGNSGGVVYAVAYLYCSMPLDNLTLYTGGSGYIKVWINQRLVHTYDRQKRVGKWDQDTIKGIDLREGYNLIVVKNVAVGMPWDFYLRLATTRGLPLKFVPQA